MLSREDNDVLCRVGPGTPGGTLMRRFWHPVCTSAQLPQPDCAPYACVCSAKTTLRFATRQVR
jgi:hypothetical protein